MKVLNKIKQKKRDSHRMRSFGVAVHFITRTIGAVPYVTASFFGPKIGCFRKNAAAGGRVFLNFFLSLEAK